MGHKRNAELRPKSDIKRRKSVVDRDWWKWITEQTKEKDVDKGKDKPKKKRKSDNSNRLTGDSL